MDGRFCVKTDHESEPAENRAPMRFIEVYLARVTVADFRRNPRVNSALARRHWTERAFEATTNWVYRSQ